jgi:Uma2 family endonuclease
MKPHSDLQSLGEQADVSPEGREAAGDLVAAVFVASAVKNAQFLAAPRALARAAQGVLGYPRPGDLYHGIASCIIAFSGTNRNTKAAMQLRYLLECMDAWDPEVPAPLEVVSAARELLKELDAKEPIEGWAAWNGPEVAPPPFAPETFRALRDAPMSAEQWASSTDVGELSEGVLIEEEEVTPLHDLVVDFFYRVLRAWAHEHGAAVFGPDHKLIINETTGRKPDVCLYRAETTIDTQARASQSPPALVIEVIAPRRKDHARDLFHKVNEYALLGVEHYWCIAPAERWIQFRKLGRMRRWTMESISDEGSVTPPDFDGLVLDLDALWKSIDNMPR